LLLGYVSYTNEQRDACSSVHTQSCFQETRLQCIQYTVAESLCSGILLHAAGNATDDAIDNVQEARFDATNWKGRLWWAVILLDGADDMR
jgi:hypothetical protein